MPKYLLSTAIIINKHSLKSQIFSKMAPSESEQGVAKWLEQPWSGPCGPDLNTFI